jgi:hypothetical protein
MACLIAAVSQILTEFIVPRKEARSAPKPNGPNREFIAHLTAKLPQTQPFTIGLYGLRLEVWCVLPSETLGNGSHTKPSKLIRKYE